MNQIRKSRPNSRWETFSRAVAILSARDRRKSLGIILIQLCLGVFDLIGVLVIGVLGMLVVTGLESRTPSARVSMILDFLHLSGQSLQMQSVMLGILSSILLVSKTVISIFFTRRILFFFSNRAAYISTNLVSRLLSQSLIGIQSRTSQETLFAATRGVEFVTIQVLATSIVLVSDISLLLILCMGLFIVDPATAIGTVFIFFIIFLILNRTMGIRAGKLGSQSSKLNISSNQKIIEVFSTYRESVAGNRRDYYAGEIEKHRVALAKTSAEFSFLPYISKYVIETSVLLGAIFIGGVQFYFQDASHAISTLAIFLAAGTRIAPAVLRIQQGSLQILGGLGQGKPTLDLIDELRNIPTNVSSFDKIDLYHEGFEPEVIISHLEFTYPESKIKAVSDVDITIKKGELIALVGPSGSGKSTLIDLLLGVLVPDHGHVLTSGLPPLLAAAKWSGAIAYVPQDAVIISGTIRENVSLGYPLADATDELVIDALRVAQLDKFVKELPAGLDTQVGERGTKISGGQRQRLGIARALFTRPLLLVLDEATSALDGETEAGISAALQALHGSTTIIMIAHRLSTIKNADQVVYFDAGKVLAVGTFDEVRLSVPDFDNQAKIGL